MGTSPEEGRARALLPPSVVALAFLAGAAISWRRLGNLLVDGGRELEVPRRLLEGAELYLGVRWYWGPLAPWVNAGLYRLFGVSYDTLMWAGLATAALACAGVVAITRRLAGPWPAAGAGLAFVFASAFPMRGNVTIFNFVVPFNFSATYGMTLAIWSVFLLLRHAETRRPLLLLASAGLAGLAAMTKAEVALAVAAAHAAYLATILGRPSLPQVGAWLAGGAIAACGYAFAAIRSDGAVWRSMASLANPASRFYVAATMGTRDLGRSLVEAGLSALGWAAVLGAAWLAARKPAASGTAPLAWVAMAVAFVTPALVVEEPFFRIAPFAMAAVLAWLVRRRVRDGPGAMSGRWGEHVVVWSFALAALARIPLKAGADQYGFYLLAPAFVCAAVGVSGYLGSARFDLPAPRGVLQGVAAAVLAGVAAGSLRVSYPNLARAVAVLRTERVHLRVRPGSPEAAFVPMLSALPPATVCAAVPEGSGFVFAAGLTPPDDGMTSYLPMELFDARDELRLLSAWERRPPDLVLYRGETQEEVFGYTGFGHDYALRAGRWIAERYAPAGEPVRGVVLMVRRDR